MSHSLAVRVAALVAMLAASAGAFSQDRGYRHDHQGGPGYHRPAWVHRDITRFHERDVAVWRSGYWHNGRHNGRYGWWWVVGGAWYFYPTQVLPYPDPYLPPVVVSSPPSVQQYWYYCRSPAGYYPYVPRCRVSWQAVPAVLR